MTGHLRLVDRAELPMDSGEDHKQRFHALRNIERAMIRSEARASGNSVVPSPIGGQALVFGAGVCLGLIGIQWLAEVAGIWQLIPNDFRQHLFWLPYAAGFFASIAVMLKSKTPRTWSDALDQELAAYNPIDKAAYRKLQQHARAVGFLDYHYVNEWRLLERDAVENAAGLRRARDTFLNKKV